MRPEPATVRMVLNAQMAKAGPPMDGRDLHIGDWEWGILPATAPLSISTLSIAGIAMAFAREGSERVALSFIGEGGSSLGEWHEAINLCAARQAARGLLHREQPDSALDVGLRTVRGPRVCRQGRRLRHPRHHDRRNRPGPGRRGIHVGGRSRASREPGPRSSSSCRCGCPDTRTTTTCCFSARSRRSRGTIRRLSSGAYADPNLYSFWADEGSDRRLLRSGSKQPESSGHPTSSASRRKRCALVETEARAIIDAPWPEPRAGGRACLRRRFDRRRASIRSSRSRGSQIDLNPPLPPDDPDFPSIARATHSSRRSLLASRTRCARSACLRLRRGCRRQRTATRSCCCGRCSRSSATASSTRRSPKAVCSVCASAPRSPVNGRSARCSSTTSSPAASTSS